MKQDEGECENRNLGALRKKGTILSPSIRAKKTVGHADCDVDVDIKVKLDDQLVNGHSEKTSSVHAPDSTDTSEVKPSEMTNGSNTSKVDSSQTVPDTCSSSSECPAAGMSVDHSQDSGVSSSTAGMSVDTSSEGSACGSSSASNNQVCYKSVQLL